MENLQIKKDIERYLDLHPELNITKLAMLINYNSGNLSKVMSGEIGVTRSLAKKIKNAIGIDVDVTSYNRKNLNSFLHKSASKENNDLIPIKNDLMDKETLNIIISSKDEIIRRADNEIEGLKLANQKLQDENSILKQKLDNAINEIRDLEGKSKSRTA